MGRPQIQGTFRFANVRAEMCLALKALERDLLLDFSSLHLRGCAAMAHQDDIALMAHLMRRAGFGASRDELEARVLKALQESLLNQELFAEFCEEFTREVNRLRMERRASLLSAKREVDRIGARIKKLLNLMFDDEIAVDEARPRSRQSMLAGRSCRCGSRRQTSRLRSCTPRWLSCTARR